MGRPRVKKIDTAVDLDKVKLPEEQEKLEEEFEKTKPQMQVVKKVKEKIARVRSKRYLTLLKEIDKNKVYSLEEGIELLKKTPRSGFDVSVEAHINLNIDPKKTDQQLRGTVLLPHGTGKQIKILVFTSHQESVLKELGADLGDKQTIAEIQKTAKIGFDKIIATPDMMPSLSVIAKILGPKGLMPNPKTGTVTTDPVKTVKDFKTGLQEYRSEQNAPITHVLIGKVSFESAKLIANFKALYEAILHSRPQGAKGELIKSVFLTTTMSPSIKVDTKTLGNG